MCDDCVGKIKSVKLHGMFEKMIKRHVLLYFSFQLIRNPFPVEYY